MFFKAKPPVKPDCFGKKQMGNTRAENSCDDCCFDDLCIDQIVSTRKFSRDEFTHTFNTLFRLTCILADAGITEFKASKLNRTMFWDTEKDKLINFNKLDPLLEMINTYAENHVDMSKYPFEVDREYITTTKGD